MPIRFRKTFKLFPGVKVNLSKGGMSVTVGPRGARLNFSKRGIMQTMSIPGSGLSESSYVVKNEPNSKKEKDRDDKQDDKEERSETSERSDREEDDGEYGCFPWGCLLFVMIFAVGGYLIAYSYDLIPPHFVSNLLQGLVQWVRGEGH